MDELLGTMVNTPQDQDIGKRKLEFSFSTQDDKYIVIKALELFTGNG